MLVRKIEDPREYVQCQLPKEELNPASIGWKGYREKRARSNGFNPDFCMRPAAWRVDDELLCSRHAGIRALEHLAK